MRFLIILSVLLLTGCITPPVKRNFPDVPKELMEKCPELKETENTESLSKVLTVIVDNYSEYHKCKIKVDSWADWYKSQKEIFESVK